MTCREFFTVVTSRLPRNATRAEIVAIMQHYKECKECREKTLASLRKYPVKDPHPADIANVFAALDSSDPEAQ